MILIVKGNKIGEHRGHSLGNIEFRRDKFSYRCSYGIICFYFPIEYWKEKLEDEIGKKFDLDFDTKAIVSVSGKECHYRVYLKVYDRETKGQRYILSAPYSPKLEKIAKEFVRWWNIYLDFKSIWEKIVNYLRLQS